MSQAALARRDPLYDFTPEKWAIVKRVISGEDNTRVSLAGVARAAGVTVRAIRRWKERSELALPEDDPLVHEISPFIDGAVELQAGRAEDTLWERAIDGWQEPVFYKGEAVATKTKFDNGLLVRFLKARDPRYHEKVDVGSKLTDDDAAEIFQRLEAGMRLAQARKEAEEVEARTIDLEEDEDGTFTL